MVFAWRDWESPQHIRCWLRYELDIFRTQYCYTNRCGHKCESVNPDTLKGIIAEDQKYSSWFVIYCECNNKTITALLWGCAEISCLMDIDSRAQELLHRTELQLKRNTKRSFPLEAKAHNLSQYCHCRKTAIWTCRHEHCFDSTLQEVSRNLWHLLLLECFHF